jgi:hypothetical protein
MALWTFSRRIEGKRLGTTSPVALSAVNDFKMRDTFDLKQRRFSGVRIWVRSPSPPSRSFVSGLRPLDQIPFSRQRNQTRGSTIEVL